MNNNNQTNNENLNNNNNSNYSFNDYIKQNINNENISTNSDTFNVSNLNGVSPNPNVMGQNSVMSNNNVVPNTPPVTNSMPAPPNGAPSLGQNNQVVETLKITEDPVNLMQTGNGNTNGSAPQVKVVPVEGDDNSGGSKLKTSFLVIFFIVLLIFVLFLPNISEIINTGKLPFVQNSEVTDGVLICKMNQESDTTDISYEMNFTFTNKKLLVSTLNITTDSTDKSVINAKYEECKNVQGVLVDGIDVNCTISGSVTSMKHSYNYKLIDNNNLTKFTEAGGIYPEYEYQDNIYDVKSKMTSSGYDCNINSK